MSDTDVSENGTPERRGFFERRRAAWTTRGDAGAPEEKPSPEVVEKKPAVIDSLSGAIYSDDFTTKSSSAPIGSIGYSTTTGSVSIKSGSGSLGGWTPLTGVTTTGSVPTYTSGGISYTSGAVYATGAGSTTAPAYDSVLQDRLDKLKKESDARSDFLKKQVEDLQNQLTLAKRQLSLQIEENDELMEIQSRYDAAIYVLDRELTTSPHTRGVLSALRENIRLVQNKWANRKSAVEVDELD